MRAFLANKHFLINFKIGVPLVGGRNYSTAFVPTASFACDTNYSGLYGPAYPDLQETDERRRGRYPIEVHIHYSAPLSKWNCKIWELQALTGNFFLGSSYIRAVLFIKNIGAAAERVRVHGDWYVNNYALDISPISNEGRYYTQ